MTIKQWQLEVSYKGVAFFVDSADDEFSRRGAHHQYPKRNKGVWEDLGKDDNIYNLNGYVTEFSIGGYASARDKLIAACTSGGIGVLVHPYYGTKKVQCTNCRVSHNDKENGLARFALSFVEAEEPSLPTEVENSTAKVNSAADAAQEAALNDFTNCWNLTGVPGYIYEAASDLVQNVAETFKDLADPLQGIGEGTSKFIEGTVKLLDLPRNSIDNAMAFFMRKVQILGGDTLENGLKLGRKLSGLTRMLSLLSGTEKNAYRIQQQVRATGLKWPSITTHTSNRKTQAKNQIALQNLLSRTAIIDSARMTPYMEFDSREEVVAVRDTLTEQIDALAETAPDFLYKRLELLRASVVADLTKRGPELGRLATYTPKTTRPALVVAYELYQDIGYDAGKATEIVMRNNIKHPGFVAGGKTLEVKINE